VSTAGVSSQSSSGAVRGEEGPWQGIGFSLGEIKEVLALRERGDVPCAHVITLIEEHAQQLAERIAAREEMRRELVEPAVQARRRPSRPESVFCHIIESVHRS